MPGMPLNPEFVGREYPASATFEVGREHIRQFADAIGDPNPIYRDQAAAQAAAQLDVVTVLGFALFNGFILIVANLVVDVLYAFVDPRVRLS